MDFRSLNLKAGLEIHQQLDSRKKLFCNCSAAFSERSVSMEIKRKLRPVSGETGEIDIAALHESALGKEFTYRLYPNESCEVEADEEPPHSPNQEALEIALEIALLLNCEIPDEIHIMRKMVVDGSNPSGFQRTAIIGSNGRIETGFGKVEISLVALEEESSQILDKGKTIFGLNRLGIPLVEIATKAEGLEPDQARELAEKLGLLLRSSRVRRGLGTIRQDLNLSIQGGSRVEIKGVQDLSGIPVIIEREVSRHLSLLKEGQPVQKEVRKVNPDFSTAFLRPLPGSARLYPETDCLPIKLEKQFLEGIRNNLPKSLESEREEFLSQGLDLNTVKALEKSGKLPLFKILSKFQSTSASFRAKILLSYIPEILKRKGDPSLVQDSHFLEIFGRIEKEEISKDSVLDILSEISQGKALDFSKFRLTEIDLDSEIISLLKEKPGLSFSAYMGILMSKHKGKVSGEEISKALKKALGQ